MDKKKTYYLVKGTTIKKKGLPKGELSAKSDHLKIEDKFIPVIEKNIDYLISQKKVVDSDGLEKLKGIKVEKAPSKKEALIFEATEFGLDFDEKIKVPDLEKLIADKKAENEKNSVSAIEFEELKKEALDLEIEVLESDSYDELSQKIADKKAELES